MNELREWAALRRSTIEAAAIEMIRIGLHQTPGIRGRSCRRGWTSPIKESRTDATICGSTRRPKPRFLLSAIPKALLLNIVFITKKHLSRRTILRGTGVTIALSLLDAIISVGGAAHMRVAIKHRRTPARLTHDRALAVPASK
jgi:hypothetical protein